MKVTLSVENDQRLRIPTEAYEELHLEPGKLVDVEIKDVTDEAPYKFDREQFRAVISKYSGSMRQQMLADGYASVDELMADIRPPW